MILSDGLAEAFKDLAKQTIASASRIAFSDPEWEAGLRIIAIECKRKAEEIAQ